MANATRKSVRARAYGRTHSDMGGDAFDEGRVPPGKDARLRERRQVTMGGRKLRATLLGRRADAAKEEAQRQVAQMFTRPEDLARLAELREGVAAKLHRAEADLAAKLNAAVDDVRFGIEALHSARKAVVDTRENFATIDALCEAEGSGLADHHDIIRDLAVMRVNISKTLADTEAIIALPAQVAAAMELLDDERNLFACWERLTELERRSRPARAALEAEAARRQPQGGTSRAAPIPTAAHFAAIDNATKEFEDTLLRSVRESIFAGRGCGRALVRALRVVEEQETLEALLAAKVREDASRFFGDDANDVEKGKQYKKRVMREVRKAVSERFAATVDALVPDEDASDETATAADVPKVLKPWMCSCSNSPRRTTTRFQHFLLYHAFESVLAPAWHRRITVFLGKLGGKAARDFSNADIIAVLNWYQAYACQFDALGVDVETVPSDLSVVPEALATPPAPVPTVPQTPRTVAPPLITKASSRRDTEATGGSGSQGGSDEPSMMSLESFLATGRAVASDGIDLERTEQSLGNDGAKTDNVSTPPRVAPREDRAGAVDSSVADDELEDDDEGFGYPLGLVKLVDVYTFRMSQTVTTWSTNLRKMTATQPLREAEDGTLWTASDVEFFRLLNEQLEVATDGGQQLVSAAAVVFSSALLDFASQQHKRLGGDGLPTPRLRPLGYRLSRHRRISGGRRQSRVGSWKGRHKTDSPSPPRRRWSITSFSRALTTRRGVISWPRRSKRRCRKRLVLQISCANSRRRWSPPTVGGIVPVAWCSPLWLLSRGTPNTAQLPLRQRSAVTPVSSHSLANSSSLTKREEVAGSKVKSPKLWWRPLRTISVT